MRILLFILFSICAIFANGDNEIIPEDYSIICRALHLQNNCLDNVKIFYAKNYNEMLYLAGGNVPEWGAGLALPEKSIVIILRQGSLDEQRKVLLHELTHIALHRKLEQSDADYIPIPRWFDEGVAQRLSGGFAIHRQSQLAWAVLWRNIFPLEMLERVNNFNSPHAKVAYAEAHDAVIFLEEYCSLGELCDSIVGVDDFGIGFQNAAGISLYEFYEKWQKHLLRSYVLFAILGDSRFLWMFIVLLFLFLGVFKMIRHRIQMGKLHKLAELEHWRNPEDFYQDYGEHHDVDNEL